MSNYITVSPSRKNFNCFFKIEQQAGYTSRNVHNHAQNRTHDRVRYPDSSRQPRNRNHASHTRFLPQQDCFPSADQTDRARKPDNPLRGPPSAAAERAPCLCNRAADAHPQHSVRGMPQLQIRPLGSFTNAICCSASGASCRRRALTVSKSAPGMRDCFCIKSQ